MQLIHTIPELRSAVAAARGRGQTIGLVPTMGALHAGHASLIAAGRRECGFVVVTIFVNPTQFGPNEDLGRYPRTREHDLAMCRAEGADAVFSPTSEEVYPPGFRAYVEVTKLQDGLCGAARPGHFRGVATVVLKLFNMAQPDVAYFGQKDAQQARIIQQMVRDLDVPIRIRICPIVREPDGLALSSRNVYLSAEERPRATVLFRALQEAKRLVQAGDRDAGRIRQAMVQMIAATPGAVIDYVELVDNETLEPVTRIDGEVLAALAVKFGGTRLIDNEVLGA
jgi:pantoate--beta-alanine ligase